MDPQQEAAFREAILQRLLSGEAPQPVSTPPITPVASHPAREAVVLESMRTPKRRAYHTTERAEINEVAPVVPLNRPLNIEAIPPMREMSLDRTMSELGRLHGFQDPHTPETFNLDEAVSVFGPNKVARTAATEQSMRNLQLMFEQNALSEAVKAQLTQIAEKYPRVLAHLDSLQGGPLGKEMEKGLFAASNNEPGLGSMTLNTSWSNSLPNTFLHELTHAAQNIGLKKRFTKLYGSADAGGFWEDAREAYLSNPFEVSARAAAARRLTPTGQPLTDLPNPHPLMKMLEDMGAIPPKKNR